MGLSYAGITLESATREQIAWVENNLRVEDVVEFEDRLTWPGKNLTYVTFRGYVPLRPLRLQSLFWPRDASRWAVGHFLVTGDQLDNIQRIVWPGSQSLSIEPWPFLMDDGTNTVNTNLYLLPPRKQGKLAEGPLPGHYIITLVDARYYWWYKSGNLVVTEGTTTWADLYAQLGAMLGVTIHNDTIPGAYLFPSHLLNSYYEQAPILLDAVAYNCGQRIARALDGTVYAQNPISARLDANANLDDGWDVQSGGIFDLLGEGS